MNKEEEKEVERKAGRAMVFIVVGTIAVVLLFWLLAGDAVVDALS